MNIGIYWNDTKNLELNYDKNIHLYKGKIFSILNIKHRKWEMDSANIYKCLSCFDKS